jgi:hypothetical protein
MRLVLLALIKLAADAQLTDEEIIKYLRWAADALKEKGLSGVINQLHK